MKSHLTNLQLGLSNSSVLIEPWSTTTQENAYYSANLILDYDTKIPSLTSVKKINVAILVISDTYHLIRCKLLFEKYFQKVFLLPSVSSPYERIRGSIREVPALIKNVALGLITIDLDTIKNLF